MSVLQRKHREIVYQNFCNWPWWSYQIKIIILDMLHGNVKHSCGWWSFFPLTLLPSIRFFLLEKWGRVRPDRRARWFSFHFLQLLSFTYCSGRAEKKSMAKKNSMFSWNFVGNIKRPFPVLTIAKMKADWIHCVGMLCAVSQSNPWLPGLCNFT